MSTCLIIASNFPPIQSAGVYRTLRMTKYLPEFDWELSVLTLCADTLPKGTNTDGDLLDQVSSDIQVHRAPARFPIETFNQISGRNKKSARKKSVSAAGNPEKTLDRKSKKASAGLFQRLKDRVTIPWMTPDRLVGWVAPASKLGILIAQDSRFNVIYSSGPPWSNHLVAARIVSATGLPWVADFRDPWVGNAFRPGRSGDSWAGRKHRKLESGVYHQANVVIFNTDRARSDAVDRIGSSLSEKSVVIPNGFDPEHFENFQTTERSPHDSSLSQRAPLKMLHTGAFYGKRNVDALLTAIGELKASNALAESDFQLELVGPIRPHEQKLIERSLIDDIVTLVPPVPHHECLQRLHAADVLLLVQTEAPLCVPGKLYEYIALGKPVFTIAASGATADLVTREKLGACIDPSDGGQLKTGLLRLIGQHRDSKLSVAESETRQRYDGRQQMTLFDTALRWAIKQNNESPFPNGVAAK